MGGLNGWSVLLWTFRAIESHRAIGIWSLLSKRRNRDSAFPSQAGSSIIGAIERPSQTLHLIAGLLLFRMPGLSFFREEPISLCLTKIKVKSFRPTSAGNLTARG